MKDKITIEIDLEPVKKHIDKYLKKKIMERLREDIDNIINDTNYPNITVEDKIEDLDKLMDWKNDIELGWIDLGQYCKKCKEKHK